MTATFTTISNILKRRYPQSKLEKTLYERAPLLASLTKRTDWTGSTLDISVQHSNTGGGSATFASAQANKNPTGYTRFSFSDVTDYSLFGLQTRAIRAAGNDAGALVRAVDSEMASAMNTIKRSLATGVYRNFGGSIGQIASGSGTATITLTNRADIVNFEVGMTIVSDDTNGTAGGADDGEGIRITAINRTAGTLTRAGGNWNAGGNFAANDFLFRQGDFGLKMFGLESHLPVTAPIVGGGDSFAGVDRATDVERLAGNRYTPTVAVDGTILNGLRRAANNTTWLGGIPDVTYMHPMVFDACTAELEDKVVYDKLLAQGSKGEMAEVSFKAIEIMTANGPMKLVADMNCPYTRAYMLDTSKWTLWSRGDCPGWLDDDGKGKFLRESTADSMEGRLGAYLQLTCTMPGANCVVDLSSAGLLPAL